MNQISETPKWWRYLARFLLIVTIVVVVFSLFTSWAIKAEPFGKYDFGDSIGFTILFMYSFVVLLGLVLLAVTGMLMGFFLKYSLRGYVIMFVISLVSVLYLNAHS